MSPALAGRVFTTSATYEAWEYVLGHPEITEGGDCQYNAGEDKFKRSYMQSLIYVSSLLIPWEVHATNVCWMEDFTVGTANH